MAAAIEAVPTLGMAAACRALELSRATVYRHRSPRPTAEPRPRPTPPRALSGPERSVVLEVLHAERFVDAAPAEVYATLLDEGRYLASERTMYRILAGADEVRERRAQARHPAYAKPELLATGPNQCWSWDITKLRGPAKWSYFYLYVLLDIFSRYVPGWLIATRESTILAERLIRETLTKEGINRDELTIHADRGSPMKGVAQLLADLGVTRSHSRPHVSDDNPYSEAQFRTLKYRPAFPDRFGSLEDARSFCRGFFDWYNVAHHHSGIALLTPAIVHRGQAPLVLAKRADVLASAHAVHPERFVRGLPRPAPLPEAVWINKPQPEVEAR